MAFGGGGVGVVTASDGCLGGGCGVGTVMWSGGGRAAAVSRAAGGVGVVVASGGLGLVEV